MANIAAPMQGGDCGPHFLKMPAEVFVPLFIELYATSVTNGVPGTTSSSGLGAVCGLGYRTPPLLYKLRQSPKLIRSLRLL